MVGTTALNGLEVTASPASFFYEKLQPYRLDPGLEFYLVTLLTEYTNAKPEETCLAFRLKDAVEAPPALKVRHFKSLGDHCLAVSGCFRDYVERQTTGRGYYYSMGRSAYKSAADLVDDGDFALIYRQLGESVGELSDLIYRLFR